MDNIQTLFLKIYVSVGDLVSIPFRRQEVVKGFYESFVYLDFDGKEGRYKFPDSFLDGGFLKKYNSLLRADMVL